MQEIAGRWLRVSTDGQDLANQVASVDQHIAQQGYETGPTYEVKASAYKGDHEATLQQALTDLREHRTNVLVVFASSRLDRQERLTDLIKEAMSYGGRIEFVTEPGLNVPAELTKLGLGPRVLMLVTEWQNNQESATKSVRIKAKHSYLRSIGSWASSLPPYGYEIVKTGRVVGPVECKTVVPTEAAAIIPEVFARVIAGDSLRTVAAWLTASGVPTEHGGVAWNEGCVRRMIQQPVYAGRVKYRAAGVDVNGKAHEPKTYMRCDAVVTQDVQDAALRALQTRVKPGRQAKEPALLKGLRCADCGAPMYRIRSGRDTAANRYAYRCFGSGAQRKGCGNNISLPVLDASVMERMCGQQQERMTVQVIPGHSWEAEISDLEQTIRELSPRNPADRARRADLEAQIDELLTRDATPDRTELTGTGQSVGDYFAKLDFAAKREYIGQHEIKAKRGDVDEYPNVLQVTMDGPSGMWYWADLPE